MQDDALSDVKFRVRALKALGSYHTHWLRLAVQNIVGAKVPATTGKLQHSLITFCAGLSGCSMILACPS